jgi:hypothetical protein
MTMKIAAAPYQSEPFNLIPGLTVDGEPVSECVLRLLTRNDLKLIAECRAEDEKAQEKGGKGLNPPEDIELSTCIARLGSITDRTFIRLCIDQLADVDIARIRAKYLEMQSSCFPDTGVVEEPKNIKILRETDIRSKPFELNPGLEINGQWHKSAVVRLLRRGEWKQIVNEQDPVKRSDLELFHSIVQIGDCTKFTMADLDNLTDVDQERIFKAAEGLRAEYAPQPKSVEAEGTV